MANPMTNEVQALRQAMLNEIEGAEFYRLAADKFAPSSTKDAFIELAAQEEAHAEYLKDLSEKLMGSTEIDFDVEALKNEVPSPGIFNWDRVDEDMVRLAVTVFSVGMNMEKDSIAFYEEAKANSKSEKANQLFDILIKWEGAHLHELKKQYDIYQQEWWNLQNFAPY
ncbi:ferritin family protein [Peptoniphilus sp. KCTC 25270]|uniref:ferritin-like domain-containing protein n=1 Tax=Peptoniphilus sp. KCTC 25270 TaxID=2897414 RepID=UPI001E4263A4|nr:ferritin family protein [Peptoniphilus sp. KCTC 25270]MCD1147412.1 ferritin family protein [Peptoniphilus sp. KCTC 25270]